MLRKGMVFALTASIALAGCAYGDADTAPAPIRDKEAKILAKELRGKVAGEPRNCINSRGVDAIRISDDTLLYRESGRLVYQNKLRGPCPGLTRGDDIMVTESFSGQLCSGDLIRLVDRTSGIQGPVCSLGDFVPYRKAK
ncbi:MAG: hypothetical protein KA312_10635 [Sphingorhabdus sp.]|nr:hypothetical protein [Sphingorhabdus sp.]